MPEALQQVREDLGEDAVILNTRQLRRNTRFNPHGEARVEITAALDEAAAGRAAFPAAAPERPPAVPPPGDEGAERLEHLARPDRPERAPAPQPGFPPPARPEGMEQVLKQLRLLQETVERLERRAPASLVFPKALGRLMDRLHSAGLSPALIGQLAQGLFQELEGEVLEDREKLGERAVSLLAGLLPPCQDIRIGRGRKVVGFTGASGAGKTTAAAKIAAGFAMKRREGIVLVSADGERVGALDQARVFAEIIGIKLETAYEEGELRAVLDRHPQARLVLIDTAGCGPHERRAWEQRRQFLAAADVCQVQVVIDGLTGYEHMLDVIDASQVFPERRLLFAKMDEVVRPGAVLSAASHSQLPTSYFSVGPSLPGAIEAGDLRKLAEKVIGAIAGKGQQAK